MRKALFFHLFLLMILINPVLADSMKKEECKVDSNQSKELPSWYFKVTLSINTPEGVKSGSSIWHEYWKKDQESPMGVIHKFEREAIPVSINDSQIIFAILKGSHGHNKLPFVSVRELPCELPVEAKNHLETDQYISHYVGYVQSVHPINYPDIVHFKNITDPESMEVIYANNKKSSEKPLDHFEENFGQGVFLKEITVEIVDQKIDWKLQNYLPWINSSSVKNYGFFRQGFEE